MTDEVISAVLATTTDAITLTRRYNRALDVLRLDEHAENVIRQAATAVKANNKRVLVAEPGFNLEPGRHR